MEPLTDDELATIDCALAGDVALYDEDAVQWLITTAPRLIADLRAARERIQDLELQDPFWNERD